VAAISLESVGVAVEAAVADRDRVSIGEYDGLPVPELVLATDGFPTLVLDHVVVDRCVIVVDADVESDFDTHMVRETVVVRVA